jgi:hypothetical protein
MEVVVEDFSSKPPDRDTGPTESAGMEQLISTRPGSRSETNSALVFGGKTMQMRTCRRVRNKFYPVLENIDVMQPGADAAGRKKVPPPCEIS